MVAVRSRFRTTECVLDQRANRRLHPHAMVCAVPRATPVHPPGHPSCSALAPPRPPVSCARPHPHGGARVPPELQSHRPSLVVRTAGRSTPCRAAGPAGRTALEGPLGQPRRPGRRRPGRDPPGQYRLPHAGLFGAARGALLVLWITFNAIWIYNMTVDTGHFAVLRRAFARVSDDQRVQAIVIAFCFGALIEALAGGGSPIAIASVTLISIEFSPFREVAIYLVANTAPVAFGGLGNPITVLSPRSEEHTSELQSR